jgi:superoxide reductase
MSQVGDVYFCELCGHKVGILQVGKGVLVCCGTPMKKQNNR